MNECIVSAVDNSGYYFEIVLLTEISRQGLIQDFLLGRGNHIFEEILDIFGQQNR